METKLPYTIQQVEFLNYVIAKVDDLFKKTSVPAHGIDHIRRVVKWTQEIATAEYAKNVFICELSAWLHDIGRTIENNPGQSNRQHHELSYKLLKQWFEEDERFNFLITDEKLELLYSVRYHWNNAANKYDTAWILRDADKMDMFGEVGLKRAWEVFFDNEKGWNQNFRNIYDCYYHLRTTSAKRLVEENNLMQETDKIYQDYLKDKIEPVSL
ncbi:MAG: HD domain-containing protein [Candidatus Magasanikiibacteriota bacterium]